MGAFYKCTSLKSIALPSSLTTIDGTAFADCTALTEITIPASVTTIGADALKGCTALKAVRGVKGSAAETYAKQNGLKFEEVGGTTSATPASSTVASSQSTPSQSVGSEGAASQEEVPQEELVTVSGSEEKQAAAETLTDTKTIGASDAATEEAGSDALSPWPFVAAGVLLLAAGGGATYLLLRKKKAQ